MTQSLQQKHEYGITVTSIVPRVSRSINQVTYQSSRKVKFKSLPRKWDNASGRVFWYKEVAAVEKPRK